MTGNTNEKRKLAYICAPYAGDVEKNKKVAIDFGKMAHEKGFLPIIPHLLFPYLDDETDRGEAMSMCLEVVEKCDALFVLSDVITSGMKMEIDLAKKKGMLISQFYRLGESVFAEDRLIQ
ncbi:DUF7768 domain-containing protein [Murdochiella massiliensis]|uniref:DUF7768 domain-containing protein n=1 Tax=Murdochiella massiliensis TaxID=1673723 RepID=UPI000833DB9B|nr:DUF4406 domain-containing protein [Murdochiella massiliensis]